MCGVIYNGWMSKETLPSFRRYQGQVLIPLMQLDRVYYPTRVSTLSVLLSVADFLRRERKLEDCERLLLLAERLFSSVHRVDELTMLRIKRDLSDIYRFRGNSDKALVKALDLAEENLSESVRLLGESNLDSVAAI